MDFFTSSMAYLFTGCRNNAQLIPNVSPRANDWYDAAETISMPSDVKAPLPPYSNGINALKGSAFKISRITNGGKPRWFSSKSISALCWNTLSNFSEKFRIKSAKGCGSTARGNSASAARLENSIKKQKR